MKINALLLLMAVVLYSCGNKGNDATPEDQVPQKPVLLFPAQNSACVPAVVLSSTQSTVLLTWDTVKYADSYDVTVKNLISGQLSTENTVTPQLLKTLERSMPYLWFVVAKSTKTTEVTISDTWKFYNPGPGAVYYAPFPADAIAPAIGATVTTADGKINLSWQGSDPDNDISAYDIYLGASAATMVLAKANVTDKFLNGNAVTSGASYYWRVVTKDAKGNASNSDIFNFKVN
jgi:hypothetical protein